MNEKKLQKFEANNHCPVRNVISRLGDKWSILVLTTLFVNKKLRFGEIQKTIGDISQRMLTVTLRSMEADGLVFRKIYAEVPPKVDYELTPLGLDLYKHIEPLIGWAEANILTILSNREAFSEK